MLVMRAAEWMAVERKWWAVVWNVVAVVDVAGLVRWLKSVERQRAE